MYSQDFRQFVLEKLNEGNTMRRVASDFGISKTTLQSWKKSIKPKVENNAGRPPKIDPDILRKDVEDHPDDYQHERAERLNCGRSTVGHSLKRLRLTKKNSASS